MRENSYLDGNLLDADQRNSIAKSKMNPNVLRKRAMNRYQELL